MTSPARAQHSHRRPIPGHDRVSVLLDTAVLIAAERKTFDMPGYHTALEDAPVAHDLQ